MATDQDDTQSMTGSLPDAPAAISGKQPYRSFKKKFAKLKVKFELGMRESEALIREELRIQDLSKRIQEQNDQLLEVLMEFNDSLQIPPNLRYDLILPGESRTLFSPELDDVYPSSYDAVTAKAYLNEARAKLTAREITPKTYHHVLEAIRRTKDFQPSIKYSALAETPHSEPLNDGDQLSEDSQMEINLGYLTPDHETEYLLASDARLGDPSAAAQLSQLPEKPSFSDRQREAAVHNPISVYNWLRRNQPQIFLQDNENASEKGSTRLANVRTSKRTSLARNTTKEEDMYDEDGIAMEAPAPSSSKGKRKREEDTGYRPKGGSRGGSRKKKESDAKNSGRRSKRSSGVGA